jgi:hypothetical protein
MSIPVIILNNTTWVSQLLILDKAADFVTEKYLRCRVRPMYLNKVPPSLRTRDILPNTGRLWRFAKLENGFYYDYNYIPQRIKDLLGDIYELIERLNQFSYKSFIEGYKAKVDEIKHLYSGHYYNKYSSNADELCKAATYVEYLLIELKKVDKWAEDIIFEWFLKGVFDLKMKGLPTSSSKLSVWISMINNGSAIVELVKPRGVGNKNALKYNDTEIKEWLVNLRTVNNYTDSYIARKIQEECEKAEKKCPSMGWLTSYLQSRPIQFITSQARYGSDSRFALKERAYIPLATALHAGDCWEVDGTRVNMLPHSKETDKKMHFLYKVVVRDVHSGAALGYDFDTKEDRWVVTNALKAAVEKAGYLPYEIRFDRFPGHNTEEVKQLFAEIEVHGVKVTIVHTAQGKARLERWFNTLQMVFMQDHKYYYGEGIRSRNNFAHRSKEYLQKMRKDAKSNGWDFDKACDAQGNIIEAFNNTLLCKYSRKYSHIEKSPQQLHEDSEKPHAIQVGANTTTYLFGFKKVLKIQNAGLVKHEIQHVTFNYRITDYNVIANNTEVLICYTLDDLTKVELYEVNDRPLKRHLCTAHEIQNIQLYGPDAEYGKLNKQKAIIAEIEAQRASHLKLAVGSEYGYDETALLTPTVYKKHIVEDIETEIQNDLFSNNDVIDDDDFELNARNLY